MNIRLISLFFLCCLAGMDSYAQDMIIKRDSSNIFCKIIKEDSLTIYYKENPNSLENASIDKRTVLECYYGEGYRPDEQRILTRAEDSLFFYKKTGFVYRNRLLSWEEVEDLMYDNAPAFDEMMLAESCLDNYCHTANMIYIAAPFLRIGVYENGRRLRSSPALAVGVMALVVLPFVGIPYIVSIPFKVAFIRHAKLAVNYYNSGLR